MIVLGNLLTAEAIDGLLKEYDMAHPRQEWKAQRDSDVKSAWVTDFNNTEDRRRMYAQQAIDAAVRIIDESSGPVGDTHGNRHHARTRASYLLGGLIGGGLLSYSQAYDALEGAVRRNTNNQSAAMQTIKDCLREGESEPITFEDKERERAAYLESRGTKQAGREKRAKHVQQRRSALEDTINAVSEIEEPENPETDPLPNLDFNDPAYDPPIVSDPDYEQYLRGVLIDTARMTDLITQMMGAAGVKGDHSRIINAQIAVADGRLIWFETNQLRMHERGYEVLNSDWEESSQKVKTNRVGSDLMGFIDALEAAGLVTKKYKKRAGKSPKFLGCEGAIDYMCGRRGVNSKMRLNYNRYAITAFSRVYNIKRQKNLKYFFQARKQAAIEAAANMPRFEIPLDTKGSQTSNRAQKTNNRLSKEESRAAISLRLKEEMKRSTKELIEVGCNREEIAEVVEDAYLWGLSWGMEEIERREVEPKTQKSADVESTTYSEHVHDFDGQKAGDGIRDDGVGSGTYTSTGNIPVVHEKQGQKKHGPLAAEDFHEQALNEGWQGGGLDFDQGGEEIIPKMRELVYEPIFDGGEEARSNQSEGGKRIWRG